MALERGDLETAQKAKDSYQATTKRFFKKTKPEEDEEHLVNDRKEFRQASFGWLLETNNQFLIAGMVLGWKYFLCPENLSELDPWLIPLIMPCPDQGGPTVCPINFILSMGVHLDPMWCMSHSAHNDLKVGLKHAGLWTHQLLMMMAWKAWKGPYDSHDHWGSVWNHQGELRQLEWRGGLVVRSLLPWYVERHRPIAPGSRADHRGGVAGSFAKRFHVDPYPGGLDHYSLL